MSRDMLSASLFERALQDRLQRQNSVNEKAILEVQRHCDAARQLYALIDSPNLAEPVNTETASQKPAPLYSAQSVVAALRAVLQPNVCADQAPIIAAWILHSPPEHYLLYSFVRKAAACVDMPWDEKRLQRAAEFLVARGVDIKVLRLRRLFYQQSPTRIVTPLHKIGAFLPSSVPAEDTTETPAAPLPDVPAPPPRPWLPLRPPPKTWVTDEKVTYPTADMTEAIAAAEERVAAAATAAIVAAEKKAAAAAAEAAAAIKAAEEKAAAAVAEAAAAVAAAEEKAAAALAQAAQAAAREAAAREAAAAATAAAAAAAAAAAREAASASAREEAALVEASGSEAAEGAAREAAALEADGVVCNDGWQRLDLRCCISLAPLADPAKGSRCAHLPRCNFDVLKFHASRTKVCPVAGCTARYPRIADVVRDDDLRERLSVVPPTVDVVWLRGTALRTTDPGAAAPTRGAPSRKRARECMDLTG